MTTTLSLQDLLRRAIDDRTGAPLRDIQALVEAEEAVRPRGMSLNRTTASQILRGNYQGVPSPATIRAIGWLAGVSDEVAFAAAGQRAPGPPLVDELPDGVDTLDRRERAVVIDLVRTLLAHRQETHDWVATHAAALAQVEIDLRRIQNMLAAVNVVEPVTDEVSRELSKVASTIQALAQELNAN
jgi:hypothetical protein